MDDRIPRNRQCRRTQHQQYRARDNQLQKRHSRFRLHSPFPKSFPAHHGSCGFDYGCTCSVASLVTSGIGFCCESLAFTCTIDRFDDPGPIAFTTIPIIVPVPLTPTVFGCRVAEMIAWPCTGSTRCTIAISWFPPCKNPPCCTSSTLITFGLYCSRKGIENKSFTLSITTPTVDVCPTFNDKLRGSNRICADCPPCAGFAAPGAAAVGGFAGLDGACGISCVGARTSLSRRTCTFDSDPEYKGRRFAFVQSGIRTMRGVKIIKISSSS